MALSKPSLKRLFSSAFNPIRSYSAPAERSIPPSKQKYVPTTGTYPKGFLAGSSHAGVKPSNTKYDDIALVVSEEPCLATAVFTRNIFKAAPVEFSRSVLSSNHKHNPSNPKDRPQDPVAKTLRGVVVNSGCANAVTGTVGREHAKQMSVATDRCFARAAGFPIDNGGNAVGYFGRNSTPETLVMSTGVIGQKLPIERIEAAIPKAHAALGASHDHWMAAANAICTTDTFPKLLSRTFTLPSHPETEYRITGMTKGAGMIHPNMGTLLAIICTDAKIDRDSMKRFLVTSVNKSFNSLSIDGDTSTNDTVAFFANGAAAPANTKPIQYSISKTLPASEDAIALLRVMRNFTVDLAKLVVRDGEGATKFVTIRVRSDVSGVAATRAATSIATSSLVKTALYGKDANWGRILCAIGYAPGIIKDPGVGLGPERLSDGTKNIRQVVPERTSVSFIPADGSGQLNLLVRGEPQEVDEERAKTILEMEDLEILVRLEDDGEGDAADSTGAAGDDADGKKVFEVVNWTCDFSHEYVTINGDYRT